MDNICHTLVGAAFGEAGLKRHTRFGNATLMIAANFPDVDVLAFATDIPAVALRRGWTHGVLGQALLPLVLTAVMLGVDRMFRAQDDRPPIRLRGLLLPQVATEYGWDAETFVSQTCLKAGLPGDAWRRGARILVFEAQVFGESRHL